MQGLIDKDYPVLLKFIVDELAFAQSLESPPKKYV